jgi:hypothetical protein
VVQVVECLPVPRGEKRKEGRKEGKTAGKRMEIVIKIAIT